MEYPVTKEFIDGLSSSSIHSVIHGDDPRVIIKPEDVLPTPLYPEDGDAFWGELLEVARRVKYAKDRTKFDSIKDETDKYMQPDSLDKSKGFVSRFLKSKYRIERADQGAKLVEADWPTEIISGLAEWLYQQGAKVRPIFPEVGYVRFTDGPVALGHLIGWAIHTISPVAFAAKWHYGRPRPEEVAHAWAKGEINAPRWFDIEFSKLVDVKAVQKDARAFTTYQPGAPNHCSYPAMHGGAAGVAILLGVWFDLSDDLLDEVRRTAANIALFRDFAGVHYRQDSLGGLHLGEEVLSKTIGSFLAQFGAEEERINAIMADLKTGWLVNEEN